MALVDSESSEGAQPEGGVGRWPEMAGRGGGVGAEEQDSPELGRLMPGAARTWPAGEEGDEGGLEEDGGAEAGSRERAWRGGAVGEAGPRRWGRGAGEARGEPAGGGEAGGRRHDSG